MEYLEKILRDGPAFMAAAEKYPHGAVVLVTVVVVVAVVTVATAALAMARGT